MAQISLYKKFLNLSSEEEILNKFVETLLSTNRSFDFFVDWKKVEKNVQQYKVEIGILSSLVGSKNFEHDLKEILAKYPNTAKVIPILVAIREKGSRFDVLEDISNSKIENYDFGKEKFSKNEIDKVVNFVVKSGIRELFGLIRVLHDYVLGVEVGLDSNARKNRSGSFMENVVGKILEEIKAKSDEKFEILPKSYFSVLEKNYKLKIPETLRHRTPDFTIKNGDRLISIETNFYSGQGSKPQEIVDAYINRQNELKTNGWHFIWITDGAAWRTGVNQISRSVHELDFVLNLNFAKNGFLEFILNNLM